MTSFPDLECQITFLPTEHGGRQSSVSTGYCPQLYYDSEDSGAFHSYPDREIVFPGDTVRVELRLLNEKCHVGRLFVGKVVLIREGNKTVGYGHVTKILNERLLSHNQQA